jgi:RNA polymerase sigma factor (sigma-70 family)
MWGEDHTVEGRPLEDSGLVERARRGDDHAYSELIRRHQGVSHRVAFLITRDEGDAEDAVQEAFVKAHSALARFRSDGRFRPWLLAIVSNEARNRVRSRTRRAGLALRVAEAHPSEGAAPSSEVVALEDERRAELLAALNRLKESDRLVIACRYFLELSEAETAATLGVARGTVKSRLSRALGRLRKVLAAVPEGGLR